MVREREREKGRERKKGEIVEEKDVYLYFTVFAHVFTF